MIGNKFTLMEVSNITGLEIVRINYWITKEWISPVESETLDLEDIARLHLINELQNDFAANEESIPLILHLIDQLCYVQETLRHVKEKIV